MRTKRTRAEGTYFFDRRVAAVYETGEGSSYLGTLRLEAIVARFEHIRLSQS